MLLARVQVIRNSLRLPFRMSGAANCRKSRQPWIKVGVMAKAQFLGVYSLRSAKNASGKRYCFVWKDVAARTCLFQPLTPDLKPEGSPMLLRPEQFRRDFTPEPGIAAVPDIEPQVGDYLDAAFKVPPVESVRGSGAVGKNAGGESSEPYPGRSHDGPPAFRAQTGRSGPKLAPGEVDKAVRAEFAMSLMRFRRGNKEGALQDFERLLAVEEGIVPAHKHMFTDFGIDLRKSRLYTLASRCFRRAANLSPHDSHALFNLARIHYEMGNFGKAAQYLDAALDSEPDLKCAMRLKMRIHGDRPGDPQGKKQS